MTVTYTENFTLYIPGHITPKQRPQISRKGEYYTPDYKECLKRIAKYCREQLPEDPTETGVELDITFYGSKREYGRSDLDNLAGSVLDGFVKSQWIKDDNTQWIKSIKVSFKESKETVTKIVVQPVP